MSVSPLRTSRRCDRASSNAASRRLVGARIVESTDELAVVGAAVPDCELTVCRLVVPPDTLQRRLRHREAGSSVQFLASVTERLAERIDQLELPGMTIHNGDRQRITELAFDVLTWSDPRITDGVGVW